jgi:hypothetical protein
VKNLRPGRSACDRAQSVSVSALPVVDAKRRRPSDRYRAARDAAGQDGGVLSGSGTWSSRSNGPRRYGRSCHFDSPSALQPFESVDCCLAGRACPDRVRSSPTVARVGRGRSWRVARRILRGFSGASLLAFRALARSGVLECASLPGSRPARCPILKARAGRTGCVPSQSETESGVASFHPVRQLRTMALASISGSFDRAFTVFARVPALIGAINVLLRLADRTCRLQARPDRERACWIRPDSTQ